MSLVYCLTNSKLNSVTYFDSFGIEHIPNEIKKYIGNEDIAAKICRMQAYESTICEYFLYRVY